MSRILLHSLLITACVISLRPFLAEMPPPAYDAVAAHTPARTMHQPFPTTPSPPTKRFSSCGSGLQATGRHCRAGMLLDNPIILCYN